MRMRSLVVIPAVRIGLDFGIQSLLVLERSNVYQLSLQSVEVSLHRCVIVRTTRFAHALMDVMIFAEFDELFGCKLAALITVKNHAASAADPRQRFTDSVDRELSIDSVAADACNNAAIIEVNDRTVIVLAPVGQEQISKVNAPPGVALIRTEILF